VTLRCRLKFVIFGRPTNKLCVIIFICLHFNTLFVYNSLSIPPMLREDFTLNNDVTIHLMHKRNMLMSLVLTRGLRSHYVGFLLKWT